MSRLPEYEPPRLPSPPDPDDLDEFPFEFPPPPPAPITWLVGDGPVWEEPGPARERLQRLVALILEVLDGRRSPHQLGGMIAPRLQASLLTRTRHTTGRQHRLRTLHTCRPVPGVIELCATVMVSAPYARRPLPIAVAGRVVRRAGSWQCTVFRPMYPHTRVP
jgi:hypothetical protein